MSYKKAFWEVLKDTWNEFNNDKVARMGAALAYYTVFSIAPLMIFVVGIAGTVFDRQAARGEIVKELEDTIGTPAAQATEDILKKTAEEPGGNTLASVIGLVVLLVGASGVFVELQDALNTIWKVPATKTGSLLAVIRDRFLSFALVFGTGFLLLVSLVISAGLAIVGRWLAPPSASGGVVLWQVVNAVFAFAFIALLFALIYKYLPQAKVAWSDVWLGAVAASLLFNVGKHLLGVYLAESGVASAFGAAGSLVVILLWVFFSAQILLAGAEMTRQYALRLGSYRAGAENALAPTLDTVAGQQVRV